jgi:uncharacterized protein YqeY
MELYMDAPLKIKLNDLLHESMKAKDEVTKDTIRLVLTSLKLSEVEKKQEMDDAGILALIQKEIKSRHEAIADFKKGNRVDLVTRAEAEIKVLEQFLPKQLSDDELKVIVSSAIAEVGAASMADMGKVMKVVIPKVQGQASSDRISAFVKEHLAG